VSHEDEYEDYEPHAEEIEAMRESELAFREAHDLLADRDWDAYCDGVGEDWLASQEGGVLSPARAFILADIRRRVQEQKSAPDSAAKVVADAPPAERWPYELTPIEEKFYDSLAETGLTFSVQPWIQHADRTYRADFVIWYDGRGVVVELDGHDFHKTKEQRGYDSKRERWLQARGIRAVRFTGSEVYADADRCVRELVDVLRESQARP